MRLNITKNFIIAFFVILAVYQTSELWFEGFSNHNFFYSFFKTSNDFDDGGLVYSLDSIIVNKGSDRLICMKNDIYKNDSKSVFDNAVKLTMENGSVYSADKFNWEEIFQARSVVYRYGVEMDNVSLSKMFGFREELLKDFSEKTDTVVIMPVTTIPERILVGFGNRKTNSARFYSIEKSNYAYTVYDAIGSVQGGKDIYYTASVKNGLNLFKGNIFIPQWNGVKSDYYPINAQNPFFGEGEFQQVKLERAVDVFFDNSASKWTSFSNGVFIYSDENTVVKYYPAGVLELYNYTAEKNGGEKDFYGKYKNAVSVLKKDSNIKNEYFLSGYTEDSEKTIFYFDYKINDFTIKLGEDIKKNTGMRSAIEITLNDGRVSKYRRLACDFYSDDSKTESVEKGFISAINEVLAEIQSDGKNISVSDSNEIIENVELIYILDDNGQAFLSWLINVDGTDYIRPVK